MSLFCLVQFHSVAMLPQFEIALFWPENFWLVFFIANMKENLQTKYLLLFSLPWIPKMGFDMTSCT